MQILEPVGVNGLLEDIDTAYIVDAVTLAEKALRMGGAVYAWTYWREPLMELIAQRVWRSPAAANLYYKLQRMVMAQGYVLAPEQRFERVSALE